MASNLPPKLKKLPFKPTALKSSNHSQPPPRLSSSRVSEAPDPQLSLSNADHDQVGNEDVLDLFRRSNKVFHLATEEVERKLRLERRRSALTASSEPDLDAHTPESAAANASSRLVRDSSLSVEHGTKRWRVSCDGDSDNDDISPTDAPQPTTPRKRAKLQSSSPYHGLISPQSGSVKSQQHKQRVLSPTAHRKANPPATPTRSRQEAINLDDDSDGAVSVSQVRPASSKGEPKILSPAASPVAHDFLESDKPRPSSEAIAPVSNVEDEFQIYIDRALARQKDADVDRQASAPLADRDTVAAALAAAATATEDAAAAVVEVFVNSPVKGTETIKARIRLNQPLKLIRRAWCSKQIQRGFDFGKDGDDDVVLTWDRKRIYDATTLASLGIGPSANSSISNWRRVHIEAWTTALYDIFQREEDRAHRIALGEDPDDISDANNSSSDSSSNRHRTAGDPSDDADLATPAPDLRIVLKSKQADPVTVTARPSTTMETLTAHFCKLRSIPPDCRVHLVFDGEKLAEHSTVADADLNDLDTLEVHFG